MPSITGASRLAAIMTLDLRPFLKNTEIAKTKLYQFQQQLQAVGTGTLRTIALGFGLVGIAAVNVAKDFNEIESQLRAIGGRDDIDKVVDRARLLGRTTKFTSTEVIKLGLELRKLGFDADRVSGAMTVATKLSQLFGGDLSKVGVTIAEVQRQFKGANGELRSFEDIGDIFAVAFKESALDITNLGGALKNVGTVASQSGLSLERTVALLGGLANSGQKAERAGTRLKTTLIRLGREFNFTEDQTSLLQSGALDTAQIFDLLKNRAGLAGAVIAQSGKEIAILEERLYDAKGALLAMSQGLEGELFISVAKIKAGFEDMAITLGDALAPYIESVAEYVEDLAKWFDGLSLSTKDWIAQATILAVVLPTLTVFFASLGAAVLALWGPLGAGVAILVALTGLFLDMQIKAAGYRKEQAEINKALTQFNDLQTSVNEEGLEFFDPAGIEASSTQALEQVLKNTEKAIEAAQKQNQRAEKVLQRGPRSTSVGAAAQDATDFWSRASAEVNRTEKNVLRLYGNQADLLDELDKREDRLNQLADERLQLAKDYADSLGFTNELVLQFQKSWEKASNDIAKALGVFGFAVNDLELVRQKIEDIRGLNLTDILEGGAPTDLLDGLLDVGTLEDQKKLAEAIAKEFQKIGVEAAQSGAIDFAKYWEEASQSYEQIVENLERKIELNQIDAASAAARWLAADLKELGLSTEDAYNKALLSAFTSELEALLAIQDDSSADRIEFLTGKIKGLQRQIARYEAKKTLDEALGKPQNIELYAQNVGILTQSLSGLMSLETSRLKSDLDAIYANFNDPNGTKNAEDLLKAIEAWQEALRKQKIQEDLEEIAKALQDIADTSNGARAVADELKKLGIITEKELRTAQLSALRTELEGLLEINSAESAQRISDLALLIKALEKEIGRLDADELLESILGAPQDVELYAKSLGILTQSVSGLMSMESDRLRANLDAIYANFLDPNGSKNAEDVAKALRQWQDSVNAQRIQSQIEDIDKSLEDLNKELALVTENLDLGNITGADAVSQQIKLVRQEIDLLKQKAALGIADNERLQAATANLKNLLAQAEDFKNAAALTSFLQSQISFLGDAFLSAARDGENFFEILKKSFLDTFYALVAKLITLIALYSILAIVSSGATVGDGGIKGAAAAAKGANFGSFLGTNLLGLNRSLSAGSAMTSSANNQMNELRVSGTLTGNNIVLANQRGTRALDRTFG